MGHPLRRALLLFWRALRRAPLERETLLAAAVVRRDHADDSRARRLPFSKTLFPAFDLLCRPATPEELS
jgi:hypothetical protein